jgi:hypothetical protein
VFVSRTRSPFHAVPLEPNVLSFEILWVYRNQLVSPSPVSPQPCHLPSYLDSPHLSTLMPIILSLAVQLSGFSCRHTSMSPVGSHRSSFLQDATFGGGRLINCEHRTRTAHDGRSKTGRASTISRFVVWFAKAHSATTPPVRRFASAPKQMVHPRTTAGVPRSCGLSALGIRTLSYRA